MQKVRQDGIMLNHKEKEDMWQLCMMRTVYTDLFRYMKIVVRFKELFGIFQSELAMLKLYDSEFGNIMIVGCKLKYLDYFWSR